MKKEIHPDYKQTVAICACGEVFYTGSAKATDALRLDVCGACHPFYTGKQKNLDTGGRIDKFKTKVSAKASEPTKKALAKKAAAEKKPEPVKRAPKKEKAPKAEAKTETATE